MQTIYDEAFGLLIDQEGEFSQDKKGGRTIYGITEKNYPNDFLLIYNAYGAGNKTEAKATAKIFYEREFWDPRYSLIPKKIATLLFSIGVNIGRKQVIRILQNTLNHYFKSLWLHVDGVFGENTQKAVLDVIDVSLTSALTFEILRYYDYLTDESISNRRYVLGWFNRTFSCVRG